MGLYDTINCKYKLPTDQRFLDLPGLFFKNWYFQTKSLGRRLHNYEITEDGKLKVLTYGEELYPPDGTQLKSEWHPYFPINQKLEMYDVVESKTDKNFEYWISYELTFKGDTVSNVTLLKFKKNDITSKNERLEEILGIREEPLIEKFIRKSFTLWRKFKSMFPTSYTVEHNILRFIKK